MNGGKTECDILGEKTDIHDYAKHLRRAAAMLGSSEMSEEDRRLTIKFSELLRAQGISLGRVATESTVDEPMNVTRRLVG